jgi:hypothetical protein
MNQETAKGSGEKTAGKIAFAKFLVVKSDSESFSEGDEGKKLVSTKTVIEYSGDLSGESVLMELRHYSDTASASVYGLERINGQLGGLPGSFVLEHIGLYSNNRLISTRKIMPGSGTGQLRGISGVWHFNSNDAEGCDVMLEYTIDPGQA